MNSQENNDILRQMRIIYILDPRNYCAPFIAVPLTLNYNYLEASVVTWIAD